MELGCQGLVDTNCTELGGTIVYQTADTKQPSTRGYSDNVAMVLGLHRRAEGLDCLKARRHKYNTNVVCQCPTDTILPDTTELQVLFLTLSHKQLHWHTHTCV